MRFYPKDRYWGDQDRRQASIEGLSQRSDSLAPSVSSSLSGNSNGSWKLVEVRVQSRSPQAGSEGIYVDKALRDLKRKSEKSDPEGVRGTDRKRKRIRIIVDEDE